MFWRLVYKVANSLIKREKILGTLEMLEEKDKVIKSLTAQDLKTFDRTLFLTKKKIQDVIVKKNIELTSWMDKLTPAQVGKRVITNRLANKYGSMVFGELYYYAKYGFVDNFFWEHPVLDTMFHPKDKDRWSFLAQWLTIYKLPPIIRTPIKMFLTRFKKSNMLDSLYEKIDRKFDEELTHQEMLYVNKQIRQLKRLSAQQDVDWMLLALNITDYSGIDEMVDGIVKYIELQTDPYTIEVLQRTLISRFWGTPKTDLNYIKIKLLLYKLGLSNSIIDFQPKSPETGNFLWCRMDLQSKTIDIKINNVWYEKHASSYRFAADYATMSLCLRARDFGRMYWGAFNFKRVAKPKKPYKRVNYNGTPT